jgi:short subunit dehydrogenase-like uncharacterized protein
MAYPARVQTWMRWLAPVGRFLFAARPLRKIAQSLVGRFIKGPDADTRATARTQIWARASAGDRRSAEAWLETCEAYRFTAESSLLCLEKLHETQPTGALSPAQAFGPDFVLEIEGTRRWGLDIRLG